MGISTQADMSAAYEYQLAKTVELLKQLQRTIQDASAKANPDWANVGDIMRLNKQLREALELEA